MTRQSVNNNTRMSLVISLCSNSNHLISLIPPKLPQILDIYSVVALYYECRTIQSPLYMYGTGSKNLLVVRPVFN